MKKLTLLTLVVAALGGAGCGATSNGQGTGPTPTPEPTPGPSDLTVADIQKGSVAPNSVVEVEGLVVTALKAGGAGVDFWAQDAGGGVQSGIYFFDADGVTPADIAVGDEVTVKGEYVEYYDLSEIRIEEVTVTGNGLVPTVDAVSLADLAAAATAELWEGCLIEVSGTKTVADTAIGFGEYLVTDGSLNNIHVNDFIFDSFEGRQNGEVLTYLAGVWNYSFEQYKLEPRSADDVVGDAIEPVGDLTIAALQDETDPNHPAVNSQVTVENMTVVARHVTGTGDNQRISFFVQQGSGPNSGIYVYDAAKLKSTAQVGDVISITGKYVEFNGLSEIETLIDFPIAPAATTAAVVETTVTLADLLASPEQYESVYVKIDNAATAVTVTNLNPDNPAGDPNATPDFNEFQVTQGAAVVRVNDLLFYGRDALALNDTLVTLRGFLNWRNDNWKLEPRDANDLVK